MLSQATHVIVSPAVFSSCGVGGVGLLPVAWVPSQLWYFLSRLVSQWYAVVHIRCFTVPVNGPIVNHRLIVQGEGVPFVRKLRK